MAAKKLIRTIIIKSPKGEDIVVYLSTRHTSYKNYEYAEASVNGYELKGLYTWENRPWQSYDFDVAMDNLAKKLAAVTDGGFDFFKAQFDAFGKKGTTDFEEWFSNFKKSWESDVSDDVKARTAKILNKTGHVISSKEEADAILGMAKAFSLLMSIDK